MIMSKEYTQIYYDEGFSDIVVEKLNKTLKENAIKLDDVVVIPGRNGVALFAPYTVKERDKVYITETKKEGTKND